jgi:hypothetical protein
VGIVACQIRTYQKSADIFRFDVVAANRAEEFSRKFFQFRDYYFHDAPVGECLGR